MNDMTPTPEPIPRRLLEIRGENTFESILNQPRTPGVLSMVRLGCVPPVERTYVFTSPKKGIHLVTRRETLRVFGQGLTITRKHLISLYLQPDDFLVKDRSGLRRQTLGSLYSRHTVSSERDYIRQMYPKLIPLLDEARLSEGLQLLSVHKALKHKIYSHDAFNRFTYPNLSAEVLEYLERSDAFMNDRTLFLKTVNELAGKYRGIEPWLKRVFAPGPLGGVLTDDLALAVQTLRMAECCKGTFSFAWSPRRMADEYRKMGRELTRSILSLPSESLPLSQPLTQDMRRFKTKDAWLRFFDNRLLLHASQRLLDKDQPYQLEASRTGSVSVALVCYQDIYYHAVLHLSQPDVTLHDGMRSEQTPLGMRLSYCYGPLNGIDPPLEVINYVNQVLRTLNREGGFTEFSITGTPLAVDATLRDDLPF